MPERSILLAQLRETVRAKHAYWAQLDRLHEALGFADRPPEDIESAIFDQVADLAEKYTIETQITPDDLTNLLKEIGHAD